MIKKLIFHIMLTITFTGCSIISTSIPSTSTPTLILPTATVPASPIPVSTEKSTISPTTITPTISPEKLIQHLPPRQEVTITTIHMVDAKVGWAIGGLVGRDDHVLSTRDGGTSWKDCTPPEPATAGGDRKTAIGAFQDALSAWVTYANLSGSMPDQAVVWRTQDGGTTWQASQPLDLNRLVGDYAPSDLQFVSGQFGWLLVHVGVAMNHDYIALFHSQDAGANWTLLLDQYNSTGIMSCFKTGILFTDATHGWLTGDCHGVAAGVLLYKSSDGGATWVHLTLPDPISAPGLFSDMLAACGSYDPFFFSNDLGHLGVRCAYYDQNPVTYQYFVYTTQDGGATWTASIYPGEALYFVTVDTGWAIAMKFQHTTDGGATWTPISEVTWTAQVDFISEKIGWGVAQAGDAMALVQTMDGGVIWSELIPTMVP